MSNDRSFEIGEFISLSDDNLVICRCEEITKGEIRRAVHDGMFTLGEIRRYLRTGMGLCQGQTCTRWVRAIIAAELGISPMELEHATPRAPMRPIEMRVLAKNKGGERDD
jgi:NAD(P)H-nitrite reductase large subunit